MSRFLPAGVVEEPVSHRAPVAVRPVLLHQHWADVVFLHWPVPVEQVALLPAGVHPDVHEGTSWVGLVHFRMVGLGLGPLPGLPWIGDFAETNVRLYSVDDEGRRGVVFRSLDADRGLPVLAARGVAALPDAWAPSRVQVQRVGPTIRTVRYDSVRRWPGPRGTATHTRVRVGPPLPEPTELEHFLTARWALHTSRRGLGGRTTVRWPNEHPPWHLHSAELEHLAEDAVSAAGLPGITDAAPTSVLHSPGLPVRFGPWRRVGRG